MSILALLLILVVLGVVGWACKQLPLDGSIQKVIVVVLVLIAVFVVIKAFFGVDPLAELQRPVR